MQSYGGFWRFPNNHAKSSSSCCDGVGWMRQREPKGQNLVAEQKKWGSAEPLVNLKSNAIMKHKILSDVIEQFRC